MIRKTLVLVFLSFACANFSQAEISETELSDGTIVRSTTTRITNADKAVNSNGGYRQDGFGNYPFRNRIEPIIIVNPPAGHRPKSGLTPNSGYAPHNGYVPDIGSDR